MGGADQYRYSNNFVADSMALTKSYPSVLGSREFNEKKNTEKIVQREAYSLIFNRL